MPLKKDKKEPKEMSDAAKAFAQLMADYETQNPEKFAEKKEELEAKLASL